MSPSKIVSRRSFTEQDRPCLCISFQAPGPHQAVSLAAELGAIAAGVARVHPSPPRLLGRRDWIVVLTTPPAQLTLAVIQAWEGEMLAVEQRWPGSHFLGWRTCRTPADTIGLLERESGRNAAGARQLNTQRELVTASLLRCPPNERRGIVHGRGVPR